MEFVQRLRHENDMRSSHFSACSGTGLLLALVAASFAFAFPIDSTLHQIP
jgi:hypothetical protein